MVVTLSGRETQRPLIVSVTFCYLPGSGFGMAEIAQQLVWWLKPFSSHLVSGQKVSKNVVLRSLSSLGLSAQWSCHFPSLPAGGHGEVSHVCVFLRKNDLAWVCWWFKLWAPPWRMQTECLQLSLDSSLGQQEPQATSRLGLHPKLPADKSPEILFSKGSY